MLHPVGQHPASVYWRRRLVVLAAIALLVVLIALTGRALFGGGDSTGPSAGASGSVAAPGGTKPVTPSSSTSSAPAPGTSSAGTKPPSSSKPASTPAKSSAHSSPSQGGSSAVPPACTKSQLAIKAVPKAKSFAVGSKPELMLRVTNNGAACVQDVSDSKIELRVYNGASRVWGSHDCLITPGTDPRTLLPKQPATFSVTWTGLSSQPGCAGTRQRVGAGTYTLYAALAGQDGMAATFTLK